jgi:hypothetical protein
VASYFVSNSFVGPLAMFVTPTLPPLTLGRKTTLMRGLMSDETSLLLPFRYVAWSRIDPIKKASWDLWQATAILESEKSTLTLSPCLL